jgi:hypothetical protein
MEHSEIDTEPIDGLITDEKEKEFQIQQDLTTAVEAYKKTSMEGMMKKGNSLFSSPMGIQYEKLRIAYHLHIAFMAQVGIWICDYKGDPNLSKEQSGFSGILDRMPEFLRPYIIDQSEVNTILRQIHNKRQVGSENFIEFASHWLIKNEKAAAGVQKRLEAYRKLKIKMNRSKMNTAKKKMRKKKKKNRKQGRGKRK